MALKVVLFLRVGREETTWTKGDNNFYIVVCCSLRLSSSRGSFKHVFHHWQFWQLTCNRTYSLFKNTQWLFLFSNIKFSNITSYYCFIWPAIHVTNHRLSLDFFLLLYIKTIRWFMAHLALYPLSWFDIFTQVKSDNKPVSLSCMKKALDKCKSQMPVTYNY